MCRADGYAFPPTDKEVVLGAAGEPDGESAQVCQVTDDDSFLSYTPAAFVDNGDLWVLYS